MQKIKSIPTKAINLLLEAGADIYQEIHKNGWTPLSWIMETPSKTSEFLPSVKHLRVLDTICELPGSKLTSAIIKGNAEDVKKALNLMLKGKKSSLKDALVNGQKMGVENHLHIAAKHNRAEFIQILIKEGLNPNFKNEDGWTPLKIAAVRGNKDVIRVLINLKGIKEADLKEALKFKEGWAVFLTETANKINGLIEKKEGVDLYEQLIEKILLRRELENMVKHSDNIDDVTQIFELIEMLPSLKYLMHTALIQNPISTKIVETLKLYGATLDDKDTNGKTAIYRALESVNGQKLDQLLGLGASLGYGENPFKILFLQITKQEFNQEYLACIKALVTWGFDPNAPDTIGETLAHLIGKFGKLYTDDRQEKVTSILIDLVQSNVLENLLWNLQDSKGKTGLDYANESGNELLIATISRSWR